MAYGLPVASTEMARFNGERRPHSSGAYWLRLPTEDCCQATATPAANKYENSGGPGMVAIAELLAQSSERSDPVRIDWGPVGLSPGLNELQIPGFTSPMRLTRSGRLIRLVVPRDPSASPTSPAKWWCKWWCICRALSPISQCLQALLKLVERTPSPF